MLFWRFELVSLSNVLLNVTRIQICVLKDYVPCKIDFKDFTCPISEKIMCIKNSIVSDNCVMLNITSKIHQKKPEKLKKKGIKFITIGDG